MPGRRVDAVARDAHGALWMNMNTGVLLRRDPDGSLWPAPVQGAVSRALLVDREGLVWAGSTDGLYRVADGIASGMTRKDGLSSDYTRAVLQDDDGTVWVGDNNGLNRWAQGRVRHMRLGPAGAGRDTGRAPCARLP